VTAASAAHPTPSSEDAGGLHLVKSVLSGVVVGVDVLRVVAIVDAEAPGEAGAHTHDLASLLGLRGPGATPPGDAPRRALVVATGGRMLRLVIGELVRVEAMAPNALRPVPAFVAELAERAGISSVFLSGEGIGYVVDVDKLAAVLRAEGRAP